MIEVANLFADLTYQGGGSVIRPFLVQLGASAAMVSIVSGLGEFIGYSLRAVSGRLHDLGYQATATPAQSDSPHM